MSLFAEALLRKPRPWNLISPVSSSNLSEVDPLSQGITFLFISVTFSVLWVSRIDKHCMLDKSDKFDESSKSDKFDISSKLKSLTSWIKGIILLKIDNYYGYKRQNCWHFKHSEFSNDIYANHLRRLEKDLK